MLQVLLLSACAARWYEQGDHHATGNRAIIRRPAMHPKWTDNRISTMQERERPMSNDVVSRIVGGSPVGVLVRLVLLSIVVGFILHAAHIDPEDIFRSLEEL